MSANDIAVHASTALTIRDDQAGFTAQQIAALRHLGVDKATEGDLAVFFHQVKRTGLDPFARQLYMVGRNSKEWDRESRTERWVTKYTIQTGIDGFRLIGRRAADAGHETLEVSDTHWCGRDGQWRDVWLEDEPPAAARVAVIRNGGRFPAVALFKEYAQYTNKGELTKMWREKGALMLAKCAEALAWRKAFPQDLSGLYTADEMQQADNPTVTAEADRPEVDVDSLLRAVEDAEDEDRLRDLWRESSAITDAKTKTNVRELIKARLEDLAQAAAESASESVEGDQVALDAEVVAAPE